jgi:hypothetical protein
MLLFYKEVRGRKVRAPHVASGKFLKKLFKKIANVIRVYLWPPI